MRKIFLRILPVFLLIVNQSLLAEDDLARMQRYSKLNQLFDSPLYSIGIIDIGSMGPVDAWDFDWFSGCIIQNLQDSLNSIGDGILLNDSTRTLTIQLVDRLKKSCPFPAKELTIKFNGDEDDEGRSLSLAYNIPTTDDTIDIVSAKCRDMLDNMFRVDSCGVFAVEGPYGHIYTVEESPEKGYVLFTCKIPIPANKWYQVPAGYAPEIGYKDLPKKAPCNTGKEPFDKFLKKFNNNAAFRLERRGFSDRADHADRLDGYQINVQFSFNGLVLPALEECGLLPLNGHYSREEYETADKEQEVRESCGQWFYPTENSVIYSGWNSDWGDPVDDCGIIILFERIEDKWNTSATWFCGNRLNEIITRMIHDK